MMSCLTYKDCTSRQLKVGDQSCLRRILRRLFNIQIDRSVPVVVATFSQAAQLRESSMIQIEKADIDLQNHCHYIIVRAPNSSSQGIRIQPKNKQLQKTDSDSIRLYAAGYVFNTTLLCCKTSTDGSSYRCRVRDIVTDSLNYHSKAVTTAIDPKRLPFHVMRACSEPPKGRLPKEDLVELLKIRSEALCNKTVPTEEDRNKDRIALYLICAAVAFMNSKTRKQHFLTLEKDLMNRRLLALQLPEEQCSSILSDHMQAVEKEIETAQLYYQKHGAPTDDWLCEQLLSKLSAI